MKRKKQPDTRQDLLKYLASEYDRKYLLINKVEEIKKIEENVEDKKIINETNDENIDLKFTHIHRKNDTNSKICGRCGKVYPRTSKYFNKDNQNKDGLHTYCKECRKLERKQRYIIEKGKGITRNYYEENRLRHINSNFIKRGFPNITEKILQKIIDNFKNEYGKSICPYCGKEIQGERDIQFDHFIPYSKKRKNIPLSNLIPVCKYCNRSKWDDDFDDWYSTQTFYNFVNEQSLFEYVNSKNIKQLYRDIKAKKTIEFYLQEIGVKEMNIITITDNIDEKPIDKPIKVKTREAKTIDRKNKLIISNNVIFNSAQGCSDYYNINTSTLYSYLNGNRTMPQKYIDLGLRYYNPEVDGDIEQYDQYIETKVM